jgi:uncharacterized protein (DUF433 family)
MEIQPRAYVENVEHGGVRVAGSRVSLASVVYMYLEGHNPEYIVDQFPVLSLEQVYGAIAFFLGNRAAVEEHLRDLDARWEELRSRSETENKALRDRLRASMAARKLAAGSAPDPSGPAQRSA